MKKNQKSLDKKKPNISQKSNKTDISKGYITKSNNNAPNIYRDIDEEFDDKFPCYYEGEKKLFKDFIHKAIDKKYIEGFNTARKLYSFDRKEIIDKTNREWEKKINGLKMKEEVGGTYVRDGWNCAVRHINKKIEEILK